MSRLKGIIFVGICGALGLFSAPAVAVEKTSIAHAEPSAASIARNEADSQAAQAIWQQRQRDMFDVLSASDSPRDWMLAAMINPLLTGTTGWQQPDQLLARAADAAPEDALVQWSALLTLTSDRDPLLAATADHALQRLHKLEPDNALVWLQDLNAAAHAKDPAGVDDAVGRMAAGTRADAHYFDIMRVALEAYQRFPLQDTYTGALHPETPDSLDLTPYTAAIAVAASTSWPAFQYLISACAIDPASGRHVWREQNCAAVGRLLAAKGDTFLTNRVGYVLLRVSATYTNRDIANARALDWLMYQQQELYSYPNGVNEGRVIAAIADQIVSGNEAESIRYALARQGIALTPPPDWVDKSAPFSTKWLEKDKTRIVTDY